MRGPTKRLGAAARRRQIARVAARLLSRGGLEALQFTDVAAAAKVTRPIVYKLFPTREALVKAILEDFEEELTKRFFAAAAGRLGGGFDDATRVFIDAICDAIDAKGPGAWELLDPRGVDARVARLGRAVQARLMKPWLPAIAEATGARPREVATVTAMLVAAGRAVLARWYAGELTRAEAARDATRGVSALLLAFTRKVAPRASPVRATRRRRERH